MLSELCGVLELIVEAAQIRMNQEIRKSGIWGARASRVLVSAPRRDELSCSSFNHEFETQSFSSGATATAATNESGNQEFRNLGERARLAETDFCRMNHEFTVINTSGFAVAAAVSAASNDCHPKRAQIAPLDL